MYNYNHEPVKKPTMKFSVACNSSESDGFKCSFSAESEKELIICKELTEKLINKIDKITIKIESPSIESPSNEY